MFPHINSLATCIVLTAAVLFLIPSCDSTDPFNFVDDFSTVPAPFDTSAAVRTILYPDTGLSIFVIEEGSGNFQATEIDQVQLFFTLRKTNGEIVQSTWANGNTSPSFFSLQTTIRGFREGVVGMRENEKRVIIIPPALGYGSSTTNSLRNDTLVYDVEMDLIVD